MTTNEKDLAKALRAVRAGEMTMNEKAAEVLRDLVKALRAIKAAVAKVLAHVQKAAVRLTAAMRRKANDEVRVSGLEARYYVRGGLGPGDVGALVRTLLTNPAAAEPPGADPLLALLTPRNRARLAAAALRGHAECGHA